MKIILKLAWRNLWRNKRRTLISISSVLFAVLMAIIAQSFQMGTFELMIDNMVKYSTGYMQIQDVLYQEEPSMDNAMLYDDKLKASLIEFSDEISYTVPRIQSFALAANELNTRGVMVMGIDPASENIFNKLSNNVVQGKYLQNSDESVMIGEGLAKLLNLKLGDTLILIGQGFQGVNASGKYPISGIVKLRVPDMNNSSVYMPLKAAQWFYAADQRLTSLIVMPKDPDKTEVLAEKITKKIDAEWYRVVTWKTMLADLLKIMEFKSSGNKSVIFILYIVISFGLFGTILTMMLERMKEFSMLISLGMKRSKLALISLFETFFMSFLGALSGTVLALPIVLYYHFNPIKLSGNLAKTITDYGFEPVMPFALQSDIFLTQAYIIFFISLIIGLYPIYKVFKINVITHR